MKYFSAALLIILSALLPSCAKADSIYVNESFYITEKELTQSVEILPDKIKSAIKENKKEFLEGILSVMDIYDDYLIPADRNNPLPEDYAPVDLVSLDSRNFKVNKQGMKLRKKAYMALSEMAAEAEKHSIDILVSSAYRSYSYQKNIYNYYVSVYGQEETDRFSARPGTSQHQLGTAVDFGSISDDFADTPEGKWLAEKSFLYGFSLSYPEGLEELTGYKYESWHYRYITPEACQLQRLFFGNIQQYMLDYLSSNIDFFREKRVMTN